ncbi:MAG: gene transfer agent family protein [Caulobacteraceae bacterium]|nr:gene transfer agent family protein [Caulobacteraceae bacterium]
MEAGMGANGARGEATAWLAGAERTLCLTLGALAEIETALGVTGFGDLAGRMRSLSAADLLAVLAALLRGGGEADLANRLAEAAIDPRAAAEAVARAFAAALPDGER